MKKIFTLVAVLALALCLAAPSFAAVSQVAATSADEYTTGLFVEGYGKASFDIWGTFSGTITLQKSYDGTNYLDVGTYTAPIIGERILESSRGGAYWRLYVTTLASGTANIRVEN